MELRELVRIKIGAKEETKENIRTFRKKNVK